MDYSVFSLGDQAVTISLSNSINQEHHKKILAVNEWLLWHRFQGMLDIIIAYSSLTIIYDAFQVKQQAKNLTAFGFVSDHLEKAFRFSKDSPAHLQQPVKKIPVCYEDPFAPDLTNLSDLSGLDRAEIISLHANSLYEVYMIGFLPGFPYMGQVPKQISVARKSKPVVVEAGSVGIAGLQTGIYPVQSPGGWQIVGRTPLKLFDIRADPPVKIEAGDRVRFYTITKKEFTEISAGEP